MSNFSVLVIGKNPEEQLAPYDEKNKKYIQFIDKTEEAVKDYKTKKIREFWCSSYNESGMEITKEFYKKLSNTKIGNEFDQDIKRLSLGSYYKKNGCYRGYYYIPGIKKEIKGYYWFKVLSIIETTHPDKNVCFEGKIRIKRIACPKQIPLKNKYRTFEEYAKKYEGYEEKNGRFGYYLNKNAKWNCANLGGSYSGYFKLKPGMLRTQCFIIHSAKSGTADRAFKMNIDFDAMYEEKLEEAINLYEELKKNSEKNENKSYHSYIEEKLDGREVFLDKHASISTFAVVKDGKWYEKGEMGWWKFVSNEKEPKDWNKEFKNLLDEIPDDTMLSIYDCQI